MAATVLAVLAVAGCKKGPQMPMSTLDLGLESIIAPHMGAEYTVSVNSNTSWEVLSSDESWIASSVEEFVGTADLTIRIGANEGEERTAVITIKAKDGSLERELPVVQAGKSAEGYISVSALRALENPEGEYTISGNDAKVKGFVVTDAICGNWFENSIAIEDSFTGDESGINVEVTGDFTALSFGDEISVPLEGAVLGRNDSGYLTLTVSSMPQKTETTPVDVAPLTVDYAALRSGEYESMYVSVEDFQVVQESIGGTWAVSPRFENADGNRIVMPVSENATFASISYNEGVGTVSGIAGPAGNEPELRPVNLDRIDLSLMRIGVKPGIRELPYVFPFYCYEQTNEKPKYLKYNKLSYNASTHLVSGVIAEELDVTVGAYLEMTVYGKEASNIYGPNYWAEQGAHDNINASSFVSLDNGKTPPAAECGFWLTVPLQMDMPADFNVSFGLCGAGDWALSDWALAYSADKQSWTEAGRVRIERVTAGGSYYFYYTLPVHLDAPILSGNNLYLKLTPQGSRSISGSNTADGHGSSCRIRLHSAIVISHEAEGETYVPSDAVYFQPFDKLTAGMDYFIGEKLGAFANYCAAGIEDWSEDQSQGMTGEKVMERPGYAQIGYANTETPSGREDYSNEVGQLTTPVLGEAGDFTLSFKAAAYRSPAIRANCDTGTPDVGNPDITEAVVEILGGGTVNGGTTATVTGLPVDGFATFTLSIEGATADTRIRFTSAPAEGQFSRWFIDDILVTK